MSDEVIERGYEDIRVEITDHIGIVTVDRPPRNTTRPRTLVEVHRAVADLDEDAEVRAIILTGSHGHFLSGADIKEGKQILLDQDLAMRERRAAQEQLELTQWRSLLQCGTPIIGAVEGDAVGIGAGLVTKCDLRVVSTETRFGWVFTRRGLIPEVGSHWLLPRLIGHAVATELLLTGRLMGASEAKEVGFVSRLVEPGRVLDEARAMAAMLATECSPLSVTMTKRLLWAGLEDPSYARHTRAEMEAFRWIATHGDASEGLDAFATKRRPNWPAHHRQSLPMFVPSVADAGPFFFS